MAGLECDKVVLKVQGGKVIWVGPCETGEVGKPQSFESCGCHKVCQNS